MLEGKTQQRSFVLHQKIEEDQPERDWNVRPSPFALNTTNPIRAIIENLAIEPNPEKSFIPLSVGEYKMVVLCTSANKILSR